MTDSRDALPPIIGQDRWLMFGLFLAGILSRLPFRSQFLYHWDSVNFALGTLDYDVRIHQPHPPGYFLYVMSGRLFNLITHDPNASFVWLSVLFSGLAVVLIYGLTRDLFGRAAGLVAALLALTSPPFWFYGEVALTYILEGSFVVAIAWACYRSLKGNTEAAWLGALVLGVAGGFRQTTLVLLLPLWIFSLRRLPWRNIFVAIFLLGGTVVAWLAPTVLLSGGLNDYLQASSSIGVGLLGIREESLAGPIGRLGTYLIYGLMAGLLPLGYGALKALRDLRPCGRHWLQDERLQVLALWLVPNFLLYAPLVRVSGHTFSFLPALLVLTGAATVSLCADWTYWRNSDRIRNLAAITAVLMAVNVTFFLAAPTHLFGDVRVVFTTPGWQTIASRDRSLAERIGYIKAHFPPETTTILGQGLDFRHPDYYLNEYQIVPPEIKDNTVKIKLPNRITTVVLFGPTHEGQSCQMETVRLAHGEVLYYTTRGDDQTFVINHGIILTYP
jgi:hypothetical protein